MQIKRGFLYAGVFLAVIGIVLLAADWAIANTPTLTAILQLWPLAVLALGVGLVARRTRYGLAAGLAAAALPGLLVGSAMAVAPRFTAECGLSPDSTPAVGRSSPPRRPAARGAWTPATARDANPPSPPARSR